MRHSLRRITNMLQWNTQFTMVAVLALLVAVSAFGGIAHDSLINFTW
jgi:hypothetical protein